MLGITRGTISNHPDRSFRDRSAVLPRWIGLRLCPVAQSAMKLKIAQRPHQAIFVDGVGLEPV